MKKPTFLLLLVLFGSNIWGCTGSLFTITPDGDKASIAVDQNPTLEAELLAINGKDSILYVDVVSMKTDSLSNANNKLVGIKLHTIRSITVRNYTNKEWVVPWIVSQGIPPVLLVIAAASAGVDELGWGALVFGTPSILSGILMATSEPKPPRLTSFVTESELDALNKYTRFPLGLNSNQLQQLLRARGQNEFRIIGKEPVVSLSEE